MKRTTTTALAAAAAMLLLAGCGEDDLGACDMVALEATVGPNQPYAGQSVMQLRCTRCHSSAATGATRLGAPAGLDFDVVAFDTSPTQAALVERGATKVREEAGNIWEEVAEGAMPPPEPAGTGELAGDEKETLRNWLACNAPTRAQGGSTSSDPWTDIYGRLMGVNGGFGPCTVCHNAAAGPTSGGGFVFGDDPCTAYARVVNGAASGTACGATGAILVVPNDPSASLLSQKLGASPSCGEIMPFGSAMPYSATNPMLTFDLDQWIASGAPKPPTCP